MLDGKPQYVELAGNLAAVSKSGEQPSVVFRAFRENRLAFVVRVRDASHEAGGRLAFVPESRGSARLSAAASDVVVTPTCTLNITLPDHSPADSVDRHLGDEDMTELHEAYALAGGRPGTSTSNVSKTSFNAKTRTAFYVPKASRDQNHGLCYDPCNLKCKFDWGSDRGEWKTRHEMTGVENLLYCNN